jgi:hypothetical protein
VNVITETDAFGDPNISLSSVNIPLFFHILPQNNQDRGRKHHIRHH